MTSGGDGTRRDAATSPRLLDRRTFDAARLLREHPPRFTDRNKAAVCAALLGPGGGAAGFLELTRWGGATLPEARGRGHVSVTERPGFFVYGEGGAPASGAPGTVHWHLNFAAHDAFHYYAGKLLAQDELQVLEHPVLAALREAADADGFSLLCTQDGRPTPVLVMGAERRGALDTRPAPTRPAGLYGNDFAAAPAEAVLSALTRIEPPTLTSVLAIEAPEYGSGRYDRATLELILATAFSGFSAAVGETRRVAARLGAPARCVIHTGYWGAGAYGGDRELMALLQLLAADLAGVDELVFYTAHADGAEVFARARKRYEELPPAGRVAAVVERILAFGYVWGRGNGT